MKCIKYNYNYNYNYNMVKTLVLYVFHEMNERVELFINHALFYDVNVDFIMISNNRHNVFEVPYYVKKIFRCNIGYDFGAWSEVLLSNNLYQNYDNFIFANSSIMGPFLNNDYKGKWTDKYLNGLKDNIKLFGSSICAGKDPINTAHVQSYIFAIDKEVLNFLILQEVFCFTNIDVLLHETIYFKEILMSRKIIENGWNIGSLMKHYENVDFTFLNKTPNDYKINFFDDVMYFNFRNSIWDEYEICFIKGNRRFMDINWFYKK